MPCSPKAGAWWSSTTCSPAAAPISTICATNPAFEFVEKDICEPFDVGRVDYVFHFASPASPVDYTIHGIATLKVGSLGTFHALDVAHKYGAKYFVSSTSECYGDPLEHPQKETYWGTRQPHRPALRLRRSQALHRGRHHGLPPLSQRGHAHRPHLQHLRPAPAIERRPRGLEFHEAGPARRSTSPSTATAARPAASAT